MALAVKAHLLRARTAGHRKIFGATNGRLLAHWAGLPVVMLTTKGRRTGLPRATMLASPLRDEGRIVVVASNGGALVHPDWFLNLMRDPDVDVVTGGCVRHMRARVASAEEKALLWPRLVAAAPSYGRYQSRTSRDIPLVLLESIEVSNRPCT